MLQIGSIRFGQPRATKEDPAFAWLGNLQDFSNTKVRHLLALRQVPVAGARQAGTESALNAQSSNRHSWEELPCALTVRRNARCNRHSFQGSVGRLQMALATLLVALVTLLHWWRWWRW